MKAEELFIGALVRVNREGPSAKKGTIVEIRGIDADIKLVEKGIVGSALCRQMDDNQCVIWCEYLEPIPITPEILEKNGFITGEFFSILSVSSSEETYQVICDCNRVMAKKLGVGEVDLECKYVHQLQHALRLCGIEKDIKL